MLSTPVISDDQIKDFEQNGYLILRQAFDADEMRLIEIWTQEMTALPEETGKHWVFHERSLKGDGADLISRIENIAPFHAGFEELSTVLKHPVGQLLGEEATLFKEKINFKMSGGDGFKPHQDSQAGWDAYADFFISALVSIDDATVENGCLQLVAGHHQRGLFKSWRPLSEDDMAGMDFVHCPTKPGDVVLFDCFAPHASEPNMTGETRRVYYATYNRAADGYHMAQYYADKHKSFPPDIDRDPGKEYVFRV
jgi:ectoine hydroxylase-related dioxygenase (phytanoyl-CoA dioxygenase family)